MDVDAVAGGHVNKVLQACAVLGCLVLPAVLDSRSKAFLGRRDLHLQLLDHRSSPRARGLTGDMAKNRTVPDPGRGYGPRAVAPSVGSATRSPDWGRQHRARQTPRLLGFRVVSRFVEIAGPARRT